MQARARRWGWLLIIVLAALVVKYIYLRTAERLVDIEELPIDPLKLVTGHRAGGDFGNTRLYGFNYITNSIFLWVFGYRITSLKLTSLAFFLMSCWGMLKVAYDWLKGHPVRMKWLPVCLIAFGPPVVQIWALKNRGGFIETWAALPWLIWLYGRWSEDSDNGVTLFIIGALGGLALWAQPIALVFVVPVFAGVAWQSLGHGWRATLRAISTLSFATLLGAMPLVALNFLYNFRTFRVIDGGEHGVGANSAFERLVRLFQQGLPRLAGLKQQWSGAWVLSQPVAMIILGIFVAVSIVALVAVAKRFWRSRSFDGQVLATSTVCLVLITNILSSWGSFQGEPRRLLLLYAPLALLVTYSFRQSKRLLIGFSILWLGVSAYANVAYVRANRHGFASPFYASYADTTNFLLKNGIDDIYAGVWVASKIEFESRMSIDADKNPYVEPSSGRVSDGAFGYRSAALFHEVEPGQNTAFEKMLTDASTLGITCLTAVHDSIRVIYGCSREFNIYKLPRAAAQVEKFSSSSMIFDAPGYADGSLEGFFGKGQPYVWTAPMFKLPFFQKKDMRGYLCIRYGTQRPIDASEISLSLDHAPVAFTAVPGGDSQSLLISTDGLQVADGYHEIAGGVPYLLPAQHGGTGLRPLGLPLMSVSIVAIKASCMASDVVIAN